MTWRILLLMLVADSCFGQGSAIANRRLNFQPVASGGGGGVVINSVTSSTFKNGDTGIVIAGSGFGGSQGAGLVQIGTTNDVSFTTEAVIGFRSISTVATAVASGNLTLNAPSGGAQNDIYIAVIAMRDVATFAAPSGEWTQIVEAHAGNTSTTTSTSIGSGSMWWCRRGASNPSFVWTRTAGDVATGFIVAYTNCVTSGSPIDTSSINTLAANSATVTTGALTTSVRNTRIVLAFAGADNTTASLWLGATGPYALRERGDANTVTGADTTIAVADWSWPPAASTGTLQLTAGVSSRHVAMACALKPITYTPIVQTVTAWGDTSITFTCVRTNGLDIGARYVFVSNNSAQTNASGAAVTLTGVIRYVDVASSAGGDGTTTSTTGGDAHRAYANVNTALYARPAQNFTDVYEVHCVGTTADVTNVDHGPLDATVIATTRDNYLYLVGNNTSGKWNTSAYRLLTTNASGFYNNGPAHVRIKNMQVDLWANNGTTYNAYRLLTANVAGSGVDLRFDGCIAKLNTPTGGSGTYGFINSTTGSGDGDCRVFNCIAQGGGTGTVGIDTDAAVDAICHMNCTVYGCQYGYEDQAITVNCVGAANSFDFVGGTIASINRNNSATDGSAGGTSPQTGTPTFVSTAGTLDLHLQAGDTVAKNNGLSDPGFGLFSYDIDGVAVSGAWSIGVDDP